MSTRSYLFILPQKENVFEKISSWNKADYYILDLQDGCPNLQKPIARENIRKNIHILLALERKIILRTNSFSRAEELNKDLKLLDLAPIDGVMLPYIKSLQEIEKLNKCLTEYEKKYGYEQGKFEVIPLIETIYSMINIEQITNASKRFSGIALGLYDMFFETRAKMTRENINFITNKVLLGARNADLPFIDSPYIDVHNYAGFYADCEKTIRAGADGKMILHPDQISIIHDYFSISEEKKASLSKKIAGYNGGCHTNSEGEFIGPPLVREIKRQLAQKTRKKTIPKNNIKPKIFKYGLNLATVYEGQTISCPYEITIDNSWLTLWSSLVYTSNYLETSDAFCQDIGLKSKVMPLSAILNLSLCMAVEPFSETCLLHLGLEDVVYENPAYAGDSLKCFIYIEKLRNTSDKKRSVITSTHVLVNQNSTRILSFRRKTMFPFLDNIKAKTNHPTQEKNKLFKIVAPSNSKQIIDHIDYSKSTYNLKNSNALASNELIIHDASRLISESENLTFTTLFRNTHPVHFNYLRYAKNEIIVCGGFVMAIVLANALKDFKQVVHQKILHCSHINKIAPQDTISSVSYIHKKTINNNWEILTIKTIGLRNVDAATKLSNHTWPLSIFSLRELRPSEMERLIQKEIPEIFHKVCVQVLWKIWRPINESL